MREGKRGRLPERINTHLQHLIHMKRVSSPHELNFITFTVVNWIDVFIRREYNDCIMENLEYCMRHKGLEVFCFALMPSHLHLIVRSQRYPLGSVVRDFKTFTSKILMERICSNRAESRRRWLIQDFKSAGLANVLNRHHQFWQNTYYPVLLYSNEVISQKVDYIHENPVKAGFVSCPEHYFYSSAHPENPLGIKLDF